MTPGRRKKNPIHDRAGGAAHHRCARSQQLGPHGIGARKKVVDVTRPGPSPETHIPADLTNERGELPSTSYSGSPKAKMARLSCCGGLSSVWIESTRRSGEAEPPPTATATYCRPLTS